MTLRSKINYGRILRDMLDMSGGNQTELAKRLSVTQPTISRWINDGQEPEKANHERILQEARVMGVVSVPDQHGLKATPLVGHVRRDGEVDLKTDVDPQVEAGMPPRGATEYIVALLVEGDGLGSLAPDGALIYYDSRRLRPPHDLAGKLCVVALKDGQIVIRRLVVGTSPGLFHLISANGNVKPDQAVDWAARVAWIELP